jgi:hypothetical protein
MPTTTSSRAASAAAVHFGSINSSRKRAGLAPLTEAQVAHEFADLDRAPFRKAVAPRTASGTGSADSMWTGIVGRLNASLPSRAPVASVRTSPAPANTRAVDWSSIASEMNREAGLTPPARR